MAGLSHHDRAYFDHWYRGAGLGLGDAEYVARKARYALAATEYLLEREVTTVLDVGCGEAPWRSVLRRLRPGLRYVGVDPSDYVVRRYGRRRSIVAGALSTLDDLDLREHDGGRGFDLVVCADVLGVVPDADARAGVAAIGRRTAGVAFVEVLTADDGVVGDLESFRPRPPATYERWFRRAGLRRVGPHLYAPDGVRARLAVFERG